MKRYRHSLSTTLLIGCSLLILLFCVFQVAIGYYQYNTTLYHRQELYLEEILCYTAGEIDADDLQQCMETGVKSEKYKELQTFMDHLKESHAIHYLYVIRPLNVEKKDNIRNVIAAMTPYEKEHHPENAVELNGLTGEAYAPDIAAKYLEGMKNTGRITFFKDQTKFGKDYTGILPLVNSEKKAIAVLAADVSVDSIDQDLNRYLLVNVALVLGFGVLLVVGLMFWLRKCVITPVRHLEKTVNDFAESSRVQKNGSLFSMPAPKIHTGDELESLSESVVHMSEELIAHAKRISHAENEVQSMRERVRKMDEIAYRDALTRVKNKAAYDERKAKLDRDIADHHAEFAMVMIDLNYLKRINDNYGHEHGNTYLQLSCHMICAVFSDTSVFRIGGDEFLVILEGEMYRKRNTLIRILEDDFEMTSGEIFLEPWERASAAIGMATYEPKTDTCTDDVFKRADQNMYDMKTAMKAGRE